MNKERYFISVVRFSKEKELNDPMVYIDEIDDGGNTSRTIRVYKNGETTCATWEGGYKSEWFESTNYYSDEANIKILKEDKEMVFFEITKEDFEREWGKVISEPGFKLRPYSEYTQEDYDRHNPA